MTFSAADWRDQPVGLDVGPVRDRPTGVGVYVRELAAALAAEAGSSIVRLGVRRGGPLETASTSGPTASYFRGGPYLAWLILHADADARRAGCRLVHWTNGSAPLRATVPFVVTIHDLSVLRMPRRHPFPRLATIPLVVAAARRARRVIVPSQATGADVRRLLHVPSSRIALIPHAARRIAAAGLDVPAVRGHFGVGNGRYILAVGTLEPRKNHLTLLRAFERIAESDPGLRLVLAGDRGWGNGAFDRALRASPVRDRVAMPGYVTDAELDVLVHEASVVAYVSLLEGYGLPVIEAMAAGVPVVTSNRSALPEVAGGAAVLVDPTDTGAVARGLDEALRHGAQLGRAGVTRASSRTWRDVALETLEVYRDAGG